ncbi:MAG: hypothetical protein QOE70_5393 [Chthoniobacter sp.]|jgi:hypothetical protein|nr:hypothetical protein [Chthoniobacter sp.]
MGMALAFAGGLAGCERQIPPGDATSATPEPAVAVEERPPSGAAPPASPAARPARPLPPLAEGPAELWKEFSGAKAFDEVGKQVAIGPRPAGSEALEKARALIEASLRDSSWEVQRQTFTGDTPRGPLQFVNLIARFRPAGVDAAPTTTQRAIVCSHYDTKRFSTISFVGASDGASSTGALVELARVLALAPALAVQVELVFFDGEEAVVQFTAPDDPMPDGLYGSRLYASELRASGRAAQFKFGILWDMIGDKDFTITLPPDSPPDLARDLLAAASALNVRDKFGYHDRAILDDHVLLSTIARIPTIDLIDFDYLYWHTADDTLDRIGPDGLQHTGAVTLYHLRKALK